MSKGSQLVTEVTEVTRQAEAGVQTHAAPAPRADAPAQQTAVYPRGDLQARDSRDEMMAMKQQFMEQAGGSPNTKFGLVQATDSDFKWLQKKREAAEFANLDAWIGRNFHKADVATRKWLQETYPEYYESRERLMIERAKLALRIKLLQLRGPKNEKDLVLQWGLQTGRIKLDDGWDRVGMESTDQNLPLAPQQRRFQNGLFSIRRYQSDVERFDNARYPGSRPLTGPNPFAPQGGDGDDAQIPSPFAGPTVPSSQRYPSFLSGVLGDYLN